MRLPVTMMVAFWIGAPPLPSIRVPPVMTRVGCCWAPGVIGAPVRNSAVPQASAALNRVALMNSSRNIHGSDWAARPRAMDPLSTRALAGIVAHSFRARKDRASFAVHQDPRRDLRPEPMGKAKQPEGRTVRYSCCNAQEDGQ